MERLRIESLKAAFRPTEKNQNEKTQTLLASTGKAQNAV
jgi:hypothetical protein